MFVGYLVIRREPTGSARTVWIGQRGLHQKHLYEEINLLESGEYNANGVTYQVQHWPNGQWDQEHNWRKVEAASEKEAAEKVCGFALVEMGMLAQLRARVLRFGDLKQRTATAFYAIGSTSTSLRA